jgi:hypothetical protein
MTSHTSHPVAAPWWGTAHLPHASGKRASAPGERLFRVRGGAGSELALLVLLAGCALLLGLFLAGVA